MTPAGENAAADFIARWKASAGAERSNYALFLAELCDLLGVERPQPTGADDSANAYVFERNVTFHHPDGTTSTGRIDLYKRGCFVLEAKQGVEKKEAEEALAAATVAKAKAAKKGHAKRGTAAWDEAMLKARSQAEQYARALPVSEGRPPLLIVVDVGHTLELYSEFSRTGGTYVPFPDPSSHRLKIDRLADPEVREALRLAWTDPAALDPSRRTARVTRHIAEKLGRLAASLEKSGHSAATVATFLMRALFTMFAEDVELLPKDSFADLLKSLEKDPKAFVPMVEELWGKMKTGGFSTALRRDILRFNGGLFENATALSLTPDQFGLLVEASQADWRDVEPAIFGTLLERALDPHERHKLGAHYTPRAYVERLVMPTVVEPLRAEWDAVQAAAVTLDRQGKTKDAAAEVQNFHRRLCEVRVLDPACGSGNFLYVTLEHLKRLEGEVLDALNRLDQSQALLELAGFSVDPHQLLGLEINPRAAAIAELVLWIGYLQWHFRTRAVAPPEPIIRNFHNIECRDAVLAYDRTEPVLDDQGQPVTRWDGRTTKKHPITGEDVPDETALVPLLSYVNPRPAEWPQSEFIVGNPPFIGNKRMRDALGDGYTEAVRSTYPDVPETADFVMYWWHKAALLVRAKKVARFGLITTNSLRQTSNRPVLEQHLGVEKLSLRFAIPDHPWVDSADGAAVRIAMTVAAAESGPGRLLKVVDEMPGQDDAASITLEETCGILHEDLTAGPDVAGAISLEANARVCFQGMNLVGEGFRLDADAVGRLGFSIDALPPVIRRYQKGRPLLQGGDSGWVIDCFGLTADEVRDKYPTVFQHLFVRVKPERDHNNRPSYRTKWWIFGEPRGMRRPALLGLSRYIVTVETSKFKPFVFVAPDVIPDHKLYAVASDDAFLLGVLSSRIHLVWALAAGGRLGVGNDPTWTNTTTFLPFPFPTATEAQQAHIRDLAERLDAHRKRQQAQHPKLTLTDCYNVLEKLRAGTPLNAKEQLTHEQGLVSVLRQLHDALDAAVAQAYGLPPDASDDAILTHLCALNAQRAAEERAGHIRWLRPEFQAPQTATATTPEMPLPTADDSGAAAVGTAKASAKLPWPKTLAEQAKAVRAALGAPAEAPAIARQFKNAKSDRIDDILDTLVSLGQARRLPDGRFAAL